MNDTPMGHNDPTDSSSSTRDPLYFHIEDNTDVRIMKNFGGGVIQKKHKGGLCKMLFYVKSEIWKLCGGGVL